MNWAEWDRILLLVWVRRRGGVQQQCMQAAATRQPDMRRQHWLVCGVWLGGRSGMGDGEQLPQSCSATSTNGAVARSAVQGKCKL